MYNKEDQVQDLKNQSGLKRAFVVVVAVPLCSKRKLNQQGDVPRDIHRPVLELSDSPVEESTLRACWNSFCAGKEVEVGSMNGNRKAQPKGVRRVALRCKASS